jgi:hypothetical protein
MAAKKDTGKQNNSKSNINAKYRALWDEFLELEPLTKEQLMKIINEFRAYHNQLRGHPNYGQAVVILKHMAADCKAEKRLVKKTAKILSRMA